MTVCFFFGGGSRFQLHKNGARRFTSAAPEPTGGNKAGLGCFRFFDSPSSGLCDIVDVGKDISAVSRGELRRKTQRGQVGKWINGVHGRKPPKRRISGPARVPLRTPGKKCKKTGALVRFWAGPTTEMETPHVFFFLLSGTAENPEGGGPSCGSLPVPEKHRHIAPKHAHGEGGGRDKVK